MPFTPAHPALILPLGRLKYKLSYTGLIAGSIVPDFEFFFQMKEVQNAGHHWYGIVLFDVPVAWLFCYFFHGFLKKVLVANLPAFYKVRFELLAEFDWIKFASGNKLRVFISIFAGVLTHLFWDGFTHADGFFVLLWPLLQVIIKTGLFQLPLYYILQIVFSIAGMYFVHYSIIQLPAKKNHTKSHYQYKYFWQLLLLIFFMILIIRITGWPQYNSFWSVIMACMGALTYSWIISTFILKQVIIFKK